MLGGRGWRREGIRGRESSEKKGERARRREKERERKEGSVGVHKQTEPV